MIILLILYANNERIIEFFARLAQSVEHEKALQKLRAPFFLFVE